MENIISALVEHVEAQLVIALAFFLGLRKGEIQSLQRNDIDGGWLHVRRNITRREIVTPKTKKSVRTLPLIQPVRGLLSLWRAKCKLSRFGYFRMIQHLSQRLVGGPLLSLLRNHRVE
jgi:integrase